MGILSRFKEIMSSNINAILDKLEDPSKMIDQIIRDVTDDLAKVRTETAGIMAEEQRCRRKVEDCRDDIKKYSDLAERAVLAGNDDDARVFLKKKASLSAGLSDLEIAYSAAVENSVKMKQMHDKLVDQLEELTARRDSIKAKVAVAKTQERINGISSNVTNAAGSISAFERMEDKANRMLDKANAMSELNKSNVDKLDELEDKYSSRNSEVDSELAALKERLGK